MPVPLVVFGYWPTIDLLLRLPDDLSRLKPEDLKIPDDAVQVKPQRGLPKDWGPVTYGDRATIAKQQRQDSGQL